MRKLCYLATVLFFVGFITTVQAQDHAGKWFLEGGVGFSSSHVNHSDSRTSDGTTINISPTFGKYTNSTTAWGIGLIYSYVKSSSTDIDVSKAHSYGIAPMFQKYWNFHERVGLYGTFSLPLTYGKSNGTKSISADLVFTPGLAFKASNCVSFELGYNLASLSFFHKSGNGYNQNNFGFNANTDKTVGNIVVGLRIVF